MKPGVRAVAVIGGGPAGSATALALARRGVRDVVLVEADAGASAVGRSVAIGESVPPAATPLLRALGALDVVDGGGHLACPGSRSLWGGDRVGFNDFMLNPIGKGYHLDRALFDEQLRKRAQAEGVQVVTGARLASVEKRTDGFELRIDVDGSPVHLAPSVVVDATGARGGFTRRLGVARNVVDTLVSICALVDAPNGSFSSDYTLLEATEYGWWYAARLPGDRLIVSVTTDAPTVRERGLAAADGWRSALTDTELFSREVPDHLVASVRDLVTRAAPVMILSAVIGPGWLAVGDAASSYDPISSAGITKALGHGIAAGDAVAEYLDSGERGPLERYQDRVFADFTAHVRLRRDLYASETRWSSSTFWAAR